ncbi:MAG TPA: hypothetical protein VFQ60_04555 [Patescibacteria group bacterium]|nr:hypothetical protein [Patescibacteria group bacterium]
MMTERDFNRLHTNQRLFVHELLERGIRVTVIDRDAELLQITFKGKKQYIIDRSTEKEPSNLVKITADKFLVKSLLKTNKILVPEGQLFGRSQKQDALDFSEHLGFPLVTKPNWGSHGDDVFTNIQSKRELSSILDNLFLRHDLVIIERHYPGKEYRIFRTRNGRYAVLHRDPAHVIGDGKHSILELAKTESRHRKSQYKKTILCPIVIDDSVRAYLALSGLRLSSIPTKGEKVYLRLTSNLAKGGVSSDVTDVIHPNVLKIAERIHRIFEHLPCIGIDFLTEDISSPRAGKDYAILEINSNPGLAMHAFPAHGKPRNVASYLADELFPI